MYVYVLLFVKFKKALNVYSIRKEVHTYSIRRIVMLVDIVGGRLENTNHICMKIVLLNKLPEKAWPLSISVYKINVSKWFKYQ